MAITDATAIYMAAPEYNLDSVVAVFSGSLSLAAPTALGVYTNASTTHDTGFAENCYYQGLFEVDNSGIFNDLGVYTPDTTGATPVFQTQTVRAYVTVAGILTVEAINWYNTVAGSGTAHTVQYKIALIAKNNQGNIQPLGTNEILYFNSAYNYQKIYKQGQITSVTSGSVTVDHNLGYVPKVRVWFRPANNVTTSDYGYILPTSCMTTLDWLEDYDPAIPQQYGQTNVTTTQVIFSAMDKTVTGAIHYRIYLDA